MSISPNTALRLRAMWTNDVPDGWEFIRFGDVLKQVRRKVQMDDDVLYDQPVIRRRHGGIELREQQYGRDIKTKAQSLLRTGDWLMSKVQILHGAYGIVPAELDGAIASGTYFTFRARQNLELEYFWYLSHLDQFHRTCAISSVGVVIEKMVFRVEDWLGLEFPLPPLPEQKKIAAILSSVDEAIQATQAVIEQTRRVKQGLLQDLLTRGIGHTRFKQTEIGEIPEGWELSTVKDFCDVRRGASPRPIQDPKWFSASGPGWVRIADVTASDRYLRRTTQYLSPLGAEKSVRVSPGDLIMSIAATIGVPIVVDMDACVHDGFVVFRDLQSHVDVEFLRYTLEYGGEALARRGQTGTQKNVNTSIVGDMKVAIPPLIEQHRIVKVLQQADSQVTLMMNNRDQLLQLKSGLLQDLLTGKVRVSP